MLFKKLLRFAGLSAAIASSAPAAQAGSLTTLYNFSRTGAYLPLGSVAVVGGFAYGITSIGMGAKCPQERQCGAVYKVDLRTGNETTLHLFDNSGKNPQGGLTFYKGLLYGVADGGGKGKGGIVYSIDPNTGSEVVLHNFARGKVDGAVPYTALTESGGLLYGTTNGGGTSNFGTIYSIDPVTGTEHVLHSFTGSEGYIPLSPLLVKDGVLYGTTDFVASGFSPVCCGTLFSYTISTGAFQLLYSFTGLSGKTADGANPQGSLALANGVIYGATKSGGNAACMDGCGTVFSFDLNTGKEAVLYRSPGGTDLLALVNGVALVGNMLYVAASFGGVNGDGAIAVIDPSNGQETNLYSFPAGGVTGPDGDLTLSKGKLYGSTFSGGADHAGTVYSLKP